MERSEEELDVLCALLPEDPGRPKGGRPRTDRQAAAFC